MLAVAALVELLAVSNLWLKVRIDAHNVSISSLQLLYV